MKETKGNFIILNVDAYEVSCRAGNIKFSRLSPLAPIRFRDNLVSPLTASKAVIWQTLTAYDVRKPRRQHKPIAKTARGLHLAQFVKGFC